MSCLSPSDPYRPVSHHHLITGISPGNICLLPLSAFVSSSVLLVCATLPMLVVFLVVFQIVRSWFRCIPASTCSLMLPVPDFHRVFAFLQFCDPVFPPLLRLGPVTLLHACHLRDVCMLLGGLIACMLPASCCMFASDTHTGGHINTHTDTNINTHTHKYRLKSMQTHKHTHLHT